MPKPCNKAELLQLSRQKFDRLLVFVDDLPETLQEQEFAPGTMNRNIRDVFGHLHQWHVMFFSWYQAGMQGTEPEMPAKGYSWKETPALNRMIWEANLSSTFEELREKLEMSHTEMLNIIDSHTDQELFTRKQYKWTGSTSLAAYLISATTSHYDWAIKLIKKGLKQ